MKVGDIVQGVPASGPRETLEWDVGTIRAIENGCALVYWEHACRSYYENTAELIPSTADDLAIARKMGAR